MYSELLGTFRRPGLLRILEVMALEKSKSKKQWVTVISFREFCVLGFPKVVFSN